MMSLVVHKILFCSICRNRSHNSYHFSGEDLNEIGIITADVNDQDSLVHCCQKGRILLNCVGPVSDMNFHKN